MTDDCVIRKEDLVLIPDEDDYRIQKIEQSSERIKDQHVISRNYTWNDVLNDAEQNRGQKKITLEQLAYLGLGPDIFLDSPGHVGFVKVAQYNVLLHAAPKYPDDNLDIMLQKIAASSKYRDCVYNDNVTEND